MEQLKSQICDNVSLYAQKYDEEFQNYLPQFVTDVWNLLVTTGLQAKYDLVLFELNVQTKFLLCFCSSSQMRYNFYRPLPKGRITGNFLRMKTF